MLMSAVLAQYPVSVNAACDEGLPYYAQRDALMAACLESVGGAFHVKEQNDEYMECIRPIARANIAFKTYNCEAQMRLREDQTRRTAARVPENEASAKKEEVVEYTFRVTGGDMVSMDGRMTLWSRLTLDPVPIRVNYTAATATAMSWKLQTLFYPTTAVIDLTVGAQGLRVDLPFLVQASGRIASAEIPLVHATRRNWGLSFRGCAAPLLVIRAKWSLSVVSREMVYTLGSVTDYNTPCWARMLSVIRFDTASGYNCHMNFGSNLLRTEAEANGRAAALQYVQRQVWASNGDSARAIYFSPQYASLVVECALGGGTWKGFGDATPGACVPCKITQGQLASNLRIRPCNRSLSSEAQLDCCIGCRPNYLKVAVGLCIPPCRTGYGVSNLQCVPCPAGSISRAYRCLACPANSYSIAATNECVTCGARAFVQSNRCVPCPNGQLAFVAPNGGVCAPCELLGTFLPTTATTCTPCPIGTYGNRPGGCIACPPNSVSVSAGRTACTPCAVGYTANASSCTPCDRIPTSWLAEYFESGCALRCRIGVAYLHSTVRGGGCRNCSSLSLPVGAYASAAECQVTLPCTNAPAQHAYYTGAATLIGVSNCPWTCSAGYSRGATTCTACSVAAFNPMRHVYTVGCTYTCRPGRYVEPTLACTALCDDLLSMTSRIKRRVSEYTASTPRPAYVHGVCNSDEVIASSPTLPLFLERGRYAYILTGHGAACGNALLDVGEACDDGNALSGDGCSATCALERGPWDCDLVGAPCLPQCGWTLTSQYVLPILANCSGGYTYYELSRWSVAARVTWMASHLISCDCGPLRTLPYAQCTALNRGCRVCGAGEYNDNFRGRCTACGSECPIGFVASASCTEVYPDGCMQCASGSQYARFVGVGCAVACIPGVSYCNRAATQEGSAVCSSGTCLSCQQSLEALLRVANAPPGYEPGSRCLDAVGYSWTPCAQALPAWAEWTVGCAWRCRANAAYEWNGGCLPCHSLSALACMPGQKATSCGSTSSLWACVPCQGMVAGLRQVWVTDPPLYQACYLDCEVGVGFSPAILNDTMMCQPCTTRLECLLGEYHVPCSRRTDASCQPCPALVTAHTEYTAPGDCTPRPIVGYYFYHDGSVWPCSSVTCALGQYPSTSTCLLPEERATRPTCLACPAPKTEYEEWGANCARRCVYGYVRVNGTECAPCAPTLLCLPCGQGACRISDGDGSIVLVCDDPCLPPTPLTTPLTTPPAETVAAATPQQQARSQRGGPMRSDLEYPRRRAG